MSLLDPKFPEILAKAAIERAGQMPEREFFNVMNVCQTMSAKCRIMAGKGMGGDADPLAVWRAYQDELMEGKDPEVTTPEIKEVERVERSDDEAREDEGSSGGRGSDVQPGEQQDGL